MSTTYEQPELSKASSAVVPRVDESNNEIVPESSDDARRLTELLLACYALHADMDSPPRVTKTAIRDMDLLLRRGPAEAKPCPVEPERVERVIHGVFDMLAERRGTFCWADQIRSPGALRRHWVRVRMELNARHKAQQTAGPDLDELIAIGMEMSRREAQR